MSQPEKSGTSEKRGDAVQRDAVAARAYAIYVRRGMKPGHEIDDWLEAERELKSDTVRTAVEKAPTPASSTSASAPKGPLTPNASAAAPEAPAFRSARPMPAPASPAEPPASGTSKKKKPKRR
jgi:hypothetical protein